MESGIIALICAASFGAITIIAAFIRQLLVSRDKSLNDEAQRRALTQLAKEFERMRTQVQSNKRFDVHYQVLGANRDAIIDLDNKIEELFQKKMQLIQRYGELSLQEFSAIVNGGLSVVRKSDCERSKVEIDEEITAYDNERINLQNRRASLWDAHDSVQEHLLKQEQARNACLDRLYEQHSALLAKILMRHTEYSERVAIKSISEGTSFFNSAIMAPIQFLMSYFNGSTGISLAYANIEGANRDLVVSTENELNGGHSHVHDGEEHPAEDTASLRELPL